MTPLILLLCLITLCHALITTNIAVKQQLESFRASVLKKALTNQNINTKGLFDKAELLNACIKNNLYSQLDMVNSNMNNIDTNYCGISVPINNQLCNFVIDTGATMNLIRGSVANRLNLQQRPLQTTTTGMGGTGSLAASVTSTSLECNSDQIGVDLAVLLPQNEQALPPNTDGLLGLPFIQSLSNNKVLEFDFSTQKLNVCVSEFLSSELIELNTKRIYTGLICVDLLLHREGSESVKTTAMLDVGSSRTILNSQAVTALGLSMNNLANSPTQVVGIDGQPTTLKKLQVNGISYDNNDSSGSNSDSVMSNLNREVFAADVPGLAAVGLGSIPACILGLDVLCGEGTPKKIGLDIVGNKAYLPR